MFSIIRDLFSFATGFILALVMVSIITGQFFAVHNNTHRSFRSHSLENKWINMSEHVSMYNITLSDQLFKDIKILCWIATTPSNVKKKAIHVSNTWGRRCNKLLFMSSRKSTTLANIIALNISKESRKTLWGKTKKAFKYVYENHFNDDYEWFIKADDDSYLIMENIRYLLYQFNPHTSLYIGNKFAQPRVIEGYMSGGSYILSKKALEKFVTKIIKNQTICRSNNYGSEDLEIGRCLQGHALAIDGRDMLHQQRFFPIGVEYAMKNLKINPKLWYEKYEWFNFSRGMQTCCSDTLTAMHYISPKEMYLFEFLIYHMHPFGLEKNLTEILPRKLTLNEVVEAANARSFSPNYRQHSIIHSIDEDEKYR